MDTKSEQYKGYTILPHKNGRGWVIQGLQDPDGATLFGTIDGAKQFIDDPDGYWGTLVLKPEPETVTITQAELANLRAVAEAARAALERLEEPIKFPLDKPSGWLVSQLAATLKDIDIILRDALEGNS